MLRSCHDSWIRQQVSDRLKRKLGFGRRSSWKKPVTPRGHLFFVEIFSHFRMNNHWIIPSTLQQQLNVESPWNCGFIIIRHRLHGLPGNILHLPLLFLVPSNPRSYDNNWNAICKPSVYIFARFQISWTAPEKSNLFLFFLSFDSFSIIGTPPPGHSTHWPWTHVASGWPRKFSPSFFLLF